MWAAPEVTQFTIGRPATPEESWVRLLRHAGMWSLMGFGYWIAETRAGAFVGEVGLAAFRRPLEPAQGDAPEAGWVLAPAHHGQGLATEAMQAVLGWADAALQEPHSFCVIDPDNAASVGVARKLGYLDATPGHSGGARVLILRRWRP